MTLRFEEYAPSMHDERYDARDDARHDERRIDRYDDERDDERNVATAGTQTVGRLRALVERAATSPNTTVSDDSLPGAHASASRISNTGTCC